MKELIKIKHLRSEYITVEWLLGNVCNFDCSYCPPHCHNGSHPFPPLKTLKKFVNALYKHYAALGKQIFIQFVGGEPSLYKDFKELLEYIKRIGIKMGILSNGSRTLRWWNEHKDYFQLIELSYHAEFINMDHYIDVVNIAADSGINVSCLMLMNPAKYNELIAAADKIIASCPKNMALVYKPVYELDFFNLKNYTKEQAEILGKYYVTPDYKLTDRPGQILLKYYNDGTKGKSNGAALAANKENFFNGWNCAIGLEKITIKVNQDIYRGQCEVGGFLGNIYKPSDINFPTSTIICNKLACPCNSEICVTKNAPN